MAGAPAQPDWNEPAVPPLEVDVTVVSEPMLPCLILPLRIGVLRIAPSSFDGRVADWVSGAPLDWG